MVEKILLMKANCRREESAKTSARLGVEDLIRQGEGIVRNWKLSYLESFRRPKCHNYLVRSSQDSGSDCIPNPTQRSTYSSPNASNLAPLTLMHSTKKPPDKPDYSATGCSRYQYSTEIRSHSVHCSARQPAMPGKSHSTVAACRRRRPYHARFDRRHTDSSMDHSRRRSSYRSAGSYIDSTADPR